MTLDCEVVTTTSGARAMRDRLSGEVMHPVVGPGRESERLYLGPSRLAARLSEPEPEALVLLDVGLGAGSNAIAAWKLSEARGPGSRPLTVVSFDRSLAALELALAPDHAEAFGITGNAESAARALFHEGAARGSLTEWRLHLGALPESLDKEPPNSADIVFWDPFSPAANPELWTLGAFAPLRRLCRDRATVHTYSGATRIRSALLLAGFSVGVGVPLSTGKFATVAATCTEDLEQPLDRRWFERLARSSAPFPPDAPGDALERIRTMTQFQ